jgi:hypothetical protein
MAGKLERVDKRRTRPCAISDRRGDGGQFQDQCEVCGEAFWRSLITRLMEIVGDDEELSS